MRSSRLHAEILEFNSLVSGKQDTASDEKNLPVGVWPYRQTSEEPLPVTHTPFEHEEVTPGSQAASFLSFILCPSFYSLLTSSCQAQPPPPRLLYSFIPLLPRLFSLISDVRICSKDALLLPIGLSFVWPWEEIPEARCWIWIQPETLKKSENYDMFHLFLTLFIFRLKLCNELYGWAFSASFIFTHLRIKACAHFWCDFEINVVQMSQFWPTCGSEIRCHRFEISQKAS